MYTLILDYRLPTPVYVQRITHENFSSYYENAKQKTKGVKKNLNVNFDDNFCNFSFGWVKFGNCY